MSDFEHASYRHALTETGDATLTNWLGNIISSVLTEGLKSSLQLLTERKNFFGSADKTYNAQLTFRVLNHNFPHAPDFRDPIRRCCSISAV